MTLTLAEVTAELRDQGHSLLRAWPRDARHLLVEVSVDGRPTAAQWFADQDRADQTARSTPGAVSQRRLVLQPGGVDRRLPGLAALATAPGAELLAHRPERRGIVRHPGVDGSAVYTKVVRPDRLTALLATADRLAALPLRTPRLLAVDSDHGRLTTASLPGQPLRELLARPDARAEVRALGETLAALHAGPVPPGTPGHDAADEAAVVRRWSGLARAWAAPTTPLLGAPPDVDGVVEALLTGPPTRPALLHRDLHDGQVLVAADGSIGLIDFDMMAAGEAALDAANLLVHLDLRSRQGALTDAGPLLDAFLEGYRPSADVLARIPAYAAAARARLAAVYAFRPGAPTT